MKRPIFPGQNLRLWRQQKGLTQEQLANNMGLTKSAISRWESGKRQMKDGDIIKAAAALNLDPVALWKFPDRLEHALAVDRFARLVEEIGPERAKALLDGLGAPD